MNQRTGALASCLLAAACVASTMAAARVASTPAARRVASSSHARRGTEAAAGRAAASQCTSARARPEAWVASSVDALVRAARGAYESDEGEAVYNRVLGRVARTLGRCGLARDEEFVERHREFVEYVETAALALDPEHELGFNVPDRQYFEETRRYVEIPDFLTERGFVRAVGRYETLERAKSYLRRLNTKRAPEERLLFFSYTSRHLGTPDSPDSYGRLLVVVPGDAARGVPEKWVQFGVPDRGARARVRNVSVVSAVARGDGTTDVYFKDFYRTFRRDGSITIKGRWESGNGDDNCAQCHKSGVLPIFPEEGSVPREELPTVEEVNQRFRGYGPPRFGGYLDVTKFGPGLGSPTTVETGARFGERAASSSDGPHAPAAVRALTCAACHRADYLGALNWPMNETLISSYVKGGLMPRGYELSASERGELYDRLIREYFDTDDARPGILKSWLLGRLREGYSLKPTE
ncbi:MAG TPA: hypothetical protein VJ866_01825 [Pyrinomonadaceae bacterium]|nr:hypothetical protein [Pyrinomonadaceae bacterium]